MTELGLYFHVPFCGRKCRYCAFYSIPYTKNSAEGYVSAVLRNIEFYGDVSRPTDTVYFGGGTPSLLSGSDISRIMKGIRESFCLTDDAEVTLEANPNTLTPKKLAELRCCGVNRLSIGVQSMNNDELSFLGRSHSAERAEKAVEDAKNAGFTNISCDLMLALPMQTPKTLGHSVRKLASLPIQHVSAYILKVEEGTPFETEGVSELLPDEDGAAELYLETVRLLAEYGFEQYEVSNFAKRGFKSRHNSRYWKCLDYIGIGPSAHSCSGGVRFVAESDVQRFIDSEHQPVTITDEHPLGFEERAMLRLRLTEGLDLGKCGDRRVDIERKLPRLISEGYLLRNENNIALTPKGFLMSNSVIAYLIF